MPYIHQCPDCQQTVSPTAPLCPKCGGRLIREKSRGVAFVLSFIIPGLGQMYQGRILTGLVLFVLFCIFIWFFFIGILFWILGMIDALSYQPKSRAIKTKAPIAAE